MLKICRLSPVSKALFTKEGSITHVYRLRNLHVHLSIKSIPLFYDYLIYNLASVVFSFLKFFFKEVSKITTVPHLH